MKSSTRPTLPVTLATWRTPLERSSTSHERGEGGKDGEEGDSSYSPAWLTSALTPLRSTKHPTKRAAPPALGRIAHQRGGFTRDLRGSWDFITIPPAGQGKEGEEKREVVVRHLLPRDDLRFYRTDGVQGDVRPEKGERFVVGPSPAALGTFWWRWGDLRGDLAGKRFQADEWWDGGEDEDDCGGADWVKSEGENGFGLTMEVENEAEVEFT